MIVTANSKSYNQIRLSSKRFEEEVEKRRRDGSIINRERVTAQQDEAELTTNTIQEDQIQERKIIMGGIVAFKWGEQNMTLLQNRDNWEARVIKAADWDQDNEILGGRCKSMEGTSFGVSKSGRVAFLVDSGLHHDGYGVNDTPSYGPCNLPILFLKDGNESPEDFADFLENGPFGRDQATDDTRDMAYNLIVGDITSSSMFHICKPTASEPRVLTKRLEFGVYTLSQDGLNATSPKDARLRRLFDEQIGAYENNQLSLEELAQRVMCDRVQAVQGDKMSSLFVERRDYHPVSVELGRQRYGTTSTTAFAVNSTKDITESSVYLSSINVNFCEIYYTFRNFSIDIA